MSRLHDALKKAEEESARRKDPNSEWETQGSGLQEPEAAWFHSGPRLAPNMLGRPGQDELDADAFIASCTHREWRRNSNQHPDASHHAVVSEEFRSLRSRLYLLRKTRPIQKLLVSSPLPQEGKTFVAVNLARIFAKQAGSRVLLIDGDLRSPDLHKALGAPAGPGLAEYLVQAYKLTSIIQRGENLFFIPGGAATANPTELIGNGRFELLLNRVAPVFDWIIIDSPPALPISDARMLAGYCDGVLMLVDAATTPFDLAQKACGEFRREQVLGVVLNRVEPWQSYSAYLPSAKRN